MLLEKAKQYAQDCISGKEITTFEVKMQCKWFLEDLEKQNNDYYPYYLDTKQIGIIEGILKLLNFATGLHIVGKSIYEGLENFQAFLLLIFLGGDIRLMLRSIDTEKLTYLYREKIQKLFWQH